MKSLPFFVFFLLTAPLFAAPVPGIKEETQTTYEKQFTLLQNFDPEFYPIPQGGQACVAKRVSQPDADEIVVECEYPAKTNAPEYLSIGTPFFIRKPGYFAAVDVQVEELDEKTGKYREMKYPINLRFVDPSGEWHQVRAASRVGKWAVAPIESSRDPHWGGDDDGVLQFPCALEYIVVDHPHPNVPRKARVTFRGVRFFRKHTTESVLTLSERSPGVHLNLEAPETGLPTHVYRVGRVPKGMIFDAKLDAEFLKKWEAASQDSGKTPKITLQVSGAKDQPAPEILLGAWKDGAQSFTLPISGKVGFQALILTPKYTDPETGEPREGQPVKFTYAVLPEESRFDDWFGICTHYAHGWNLETQKFLPPAGLRFFRDEMGWGSCEPEKGKYVFSPRWDEYINSAREKGLEPLLILDYANQNYDGGDFPHTDEAVQGYANYCRAIAQHFKGRIKHYEIWNEWTGGCGMSGKKHNTPENYVKLIAAAYKVLKEVDPDCVVIGGGGDHHVGHFKAIEAQMKLGVMKYCDAFSVHPYEYPRTPEEAKVVENLQKVVDCMKANGCEEPKLWLTELGWPTHGAGHAPGFDSRDAAVREALEAQMFVRAGIGYRAMPEVRKFVWYDLKNDGTDLSYNENNFGIIHHDSYRFQPKAAFQAVAVLTGFTAGATVTRSARYSTPELAVYEIKRPDSPVVYAAWSLAKGSAAVKVSFPFQKAMNIYGEELDGVTEVTGEPVYFY